MSRFNRKNWYKSTVVLTNRTPFPLTSASGSTQVNTPSQASSPRALTLRSLSALSITLQDCINICPKKYKNMRIHAPDLANAHMQCAFTSGIDLASEGFRRSNTINLVTAQSEKESAESAPILPDEGVGQEGHGHCVAAKCAPYALILAIAAQYSPHQLGATSE